MHAYLLLILTLTSLSTSAGIRKYYYIDAISGNDANSGLSVSSAWRSLDRVNAAQSVLSSGDEVLFHAGQRFSGQLRLRVSGVKYGSYGSGARPVISGFVTLDSWTPLGSGVYETSLNSGRALGMVSVNGVATGMGRYPNADAASGGYLTIGSHSGTGSISSSSLSGVPDMSGAEVVIRKRHWVLDRCRILSHAGNTINYASPTSFDAIDGYGFFIQNHPWTLDRAGEWWYDAVNKKLRMYFGSSGPAAYNVQASAVDTLVQIYYGFNSSPTSDISFSGLRLEGADSLGINVHYSRNLKISDCEIALTGSNGINGDNADNLKIENCSISQSNNKGIHTMYSNYVKVSGTRVTNSGLLKGMGMSNNQNHTGIGLTCERGCEVTESRVDSSGYCGIAVTGDSFYVHHNFVTNFCLTVDDGGGIYTWGADGRRGRRITDNIVLGGVGAGYGTEKTENSNAHGISLDDRSVNVEITGNSVAHCNGSGITLHNSHHVSIRNNTAFNAQAQVALNHDNLEPDVPIRNVELQENILVARTMEQFVLINSSMSDDFRQSGSFDNNYYSRPLDSTGMIMNYYEGDVMAHDLGVWNYKYVHDAATKNNFSILNYKVNSTAGNVVANGDFNSNTNGTSCASVPSGCSISWVNGQLDGGTMRVAPGGGVNDVIFTNIDLGNVIAGRDYILHFTTRATGERNTLAATVLHAGGGFENRSGGNYFPLLTGRSEHQFRFHASNTETVFLAVKLYGLDAAFYIDNVSLKEANLTVTNPDDSIRFVYNETSVPKTFFLDGNYRDIKQNIYPSTITLQSFTSAVLIKVPMFYVLPANRPPFADAGADVEVAHVPSIIRLDAGRSADIDGSIVKYEWTVLKAPHPVRILHEDAKVASVADAGPGSYSFLLTVEDNAGARATDVINWKIGGQDAVQLHLFPNPASRILNFRYNSTSAGMFEIRIVNAAGMVVLKKSLQKQDESVFGNLDISALAKGGYFLEIVGEGKKMTSYFIKN